MIRFLHLLFDLCCKKSTVGRFVLISEGVLALMIALWTLGTEASGQFVESFDRPGNYFRLWRDDCDARLFRPETREPGVETLELRFRAGSYVQLIYPISPSAVVDDLSASMRIRSGHSDLRIGMRVVFPNSTHPATQDPMLAVVFGTPTREAGTWSQSTVRNITKELENQQRLLRAQFGPTIDLSQPYVDAIVLDVYRYPGTTKVQLDDLLIEGMIPPSYEDPIRVPDGNSLSASNNSKTVEQRLLEMQSTVPRWIQHHGESLDYLQSLGFNGVITSRATDALIVEQSIRTKMAVIAPPPETLITERAASGYQHVHGWLLGWELNESHLDGVRQQVSNMSRLPVTLARPTIGEAMELYGSYSRLTDWLAVPTPHSTRVRSSEEADSIIRTDARAMTGRSYPLTSMVTQMSSEWIEQKALLQEALGGDAVGMPDYDLLQNRLALYRGMMQGTRGWIFRSSGALDRGDPTSAKRGEGYAAINNEIDLFSPWIQANQSPWKSVATNSNQHRAAALTTPNSQLVILVASGPMDQICAVSPETEKVEIALPTTGQVRYVFRVTYGHLETLRAERRSDSLYVTVERPSLVEQIVTVVDPKPIAYLREQLERRAPQLMESRIDMAQQTLQLAQMILVSQRVPNNSPQWETVRNAQSFHNQAMHAMSRSNVTRALTSADQSVMLSQRVIRASWEEAIQQFTSFQSSPLVASPLSLPLHWDLHRVLAGREWQWLSIPGTPFSSWESMQQVGWKVDQRLQNIITTYAGTEPAGPQKQSALVLASSAASQQPVPSGYAGAAMRVSSARIIAPVGSLVHIQGSVQIESPANEPQSGLLISDSLGGESLGQLISSADPSKDSWRKFGLFRFVTNPDGFQVYFETRGEVLARVTDLKADMIIPTMARNAPIQPIDEPNATSDNDAVRINASRNQTLPAIK
jgi:hypothetical protein